MKYALLSALILGATTMALPCSAQFSSFPVGSDGCSNLCVRLDLGSSNNGSSFGGFNSGFNSGVNNSFNSGSSNGSSGVRWQIGITWRPTAPEVSLAESERVKRQLEDNRSLMIALAEAITQNKTEMAHGLAILLAPRLGYSDPRKLLADLKEGSMNIGAAKIEIQKGTTNTAPALIQSRPGTTNVIPVPTQSQPGTTNIAPALSNPPPAIIELR